MPDWHTWSVEQAAAALESTLDSGLSAEQAAARLARHGPNQLEERGQATIWRMLWNQCASVMVALLLAAAAIALLLGDVSDAAVILIIVALNTALGFAQEFRAERAMAALRAMAVPAAVVYRDGCRQHVPAPQLVPGDVIALEAGDRVPADCRLIEAVHLITQEAALTGESEPVSKAAGSLADPALPLGNRRNMAFMGTLVATGHGAGLVVATGMRTELGAIASLLQGVGHERTPLQRRLDRLGRVLAALSIGLVGIIFLLGLARGEPLRRMFLTAVGMAVAAVPEGLPAVVTIALALGAQRMLKQRALMRSLSAVETLGAVTVICSDKTGTLTENRMAVSAVVGADQIAAQADQPPATAPSPAPPAAGSPGLGLLLAASVLCNNARLAAGPAAEALGDPTELALVAHGQAAGLAKAGLEARLPRIAELPFDSDRCCMTTVHALPMASGDAPWQAALGGLVEPASVALAFSKGALDRILDHSTHVWLAGGRVPLDASMRLAVQAAGDRLAGQGQRVLAFAARALASPPPTDNPDAVERRLTLLGLIALRDPVRPAAHAAVERCMQAGIRPVMITGDHALTARAIAREVGIDDRATLTGAELDRLSDADVRAAVAQTAIYARVSPAHKLRIVSALQQRGEIVAMTGDGVNDAPALKQADIGVAMGLSGTDVAREAASMVLQDDQFATIVDAVREGRVIYDNIRKFIRFLLTTNAAELWVMLLAMLVGMPLPLLPLQLLWINLVTDGLPALALGLEPGERHSMRRPPRSPQESLLARGLGLHVLWVGSAMAALTLGAGYWSWSRGQAQWQTILFTTLTLAQMAHVLAIRSESESVLRTGLRSNPWLLGAVLLTIGLQAAVVSLPWLQAIFGTVALGAGDWLLCAAVSLVIIGCVELEKWRTRVRLARSDGAAVPPPAARHDQQTAHHLQS